jgi:hypothetical protein
VTEEREALLAHGDELWSRLAAALDASLDRPFGPSTDWTGHDVYAHFARWTARTVSDTRCALNGEPREHLDGTEDEINTRWRDEDHALSTATVKRRCNQARAELQSLLRSLSDDQWQAFGPLCAQDITAAHIEPHLRMIGQ